MIRINYSDVFVEALSRFESGVKESLEELIEQVKEEKSEVRQSKELVPYNELFTMGLSLPLNLRTVYMYLLTIGECDLKSVEQNCNLDFKSAKKVLDKLISHGYVIMIVDSTTHNETYSIIRERKKARFEYENYVWKGFRGGSGIPLVFHYNLLCDDVRLRSFRDSILNTVNEGDIVVDLGAGPGILSLIAAEKAEKVYAVDIDPYTIAAGKKIVNRCLNSDKIEFVQADARIVELEEKADVVLCEMLDTALIAEHQVPVMNNAVNNVLKNGGKVIPLKALTTIELVESNYDFYGYKFDLPYYEEYGARHVVNVVSEPHVLHDVYFNEINPLYLRKTIKFDIDKKAKFDSFRLKTTLYLDEDTLVEPTPWMNPPLVFPIVEDTNNLSESFEFSEEVELSISYEMGSSLENVKYSII